jgi:hypothetical protein
MAIYTDCPLMESGPVMVLTSWSIASLKVRTADEMLKRHALLYENHIRTFILICSVFNYDFQ